MLDNKFRRTFVGMAAFAICAFYAATGTSQAAALDAAQKKAIIDEIAVALKTNGIFLETVRKIEEAPRGAN